MAEALSQSDIDSLLAMAAEHPAAAANGDAAAPGTPATAARPPRQTRVVRAPGRVNLIGEHTDYNDGFVFPMAIEPEVRVACRGRDDGVVRLASTAFPTQVVEFSVQQKIEPIGRPGVSAASCARSASNAVRHAS